MLIKEQLFTIAIVIDLSQKTFFRKLNLPKPSTDYLKRTMSDKSS